MANFPAPCTSKEFSLIKILNNQNHLTWMCFFSIRRRLFRQRTTGGNVVSLGTRIMLVCHHLCCSGPFFRLFGNPFWVTLLIKLLEPVFNYAKSLFSIFRSAHWRTPTQTNTPSPGPTTASLSEFPWPNGCHGDSPIKPVDKRAQKNRRAFNVQI